MAAAACGAGMTILTETTWDGIDTLASGQKRYV